LQLKKIFENIKSKKIIELDGCHTLAKIFIFKLRVNKDKERKKMKTKFRVFGFNSFNLKKILKKNRVELIPQILCLIKKRVLLEGTVMKIHRKTEHIAALLIECDHCGSTFYFVLDTLNQLLPFLCNKTNCNSRQFFSHFSRILTEKLQKVKLGAVFINYQKLKNNQSIFLEIYGLHKSLLFKGMKIICNANVNLLPISKNHSTGITERNLFGLYTQTRNYKILFSTYIGYKDIYFLSKEDFLFIKQLYSHGDLFHVLIKNIQPNKSRNEGLKACLLLLISQQLSNLNKIPENKKSMNMCLILSNNSITDDSFITEIVRSFPKSFFFNFENFNFIFKKNITNDQFKENGVYKRFKHSILFIDFNERIGRNTEPKSLLYKIKKNLEKINIISFQCILVFYIKIDKKYLKKNSDSPSFLNEDPNFGKIFPFHFSAKDFLTKNTEKSAASYLLSYQNYKGKIPLHPIVSTVNKNLTRFSIYNSLFFKKKLSGYFFKKFINFLQNFPNSSLSDISINIVVQIYTKLKKLKVCFLKSPVDFLLILLKLSQCRAKIDLRDQICIDDVFDSIEIFLDSKPTLVANLITNIKFKFKKTHAQLKFVSKFLSLLHKFFYRTGQTLFELEVLVAIFGSGMIFSEIIEVLENFKIIKNIKKNLFTIKI